MTMTQEQAEKMVDDLITAVSWRDMYSAKRAALIAALTARPGVPDGWKMVPVEPTEAMLSAWQKGHFAAIEKGQSFTGWAQGWAAMLAAAPPAPVVVPDFATAEMLDAGLAEFSKQGAIYVSFRDLLARAYVAMKAAAPVAEPTADDWYAICERQHKEVGVTPALRQAYDLYLASAIVAEHDPTNPFAPRDNNVQRAAKERAQVFEEGRLRGRAECVAERSMGEIVDRIYTPGMSGARRSRRKMRRVKKSLL